MQDSWITTRQQVIARRKARIQLIQRRAGKAFAALRKRAGLTGKELGHLIDWSQKSISNYETGKCNISEQQARLSSDLFGVSVDALFPVEVRRTNGDSSIDWAVSTLTIPLAPLCSCSDPEEAVRLRELSAVIRQVLGALNKRERQVLVLRFGIEGDGCKTLGEIGDLFGVTQERIRQVEERALHRLRHPLQARKLREFLDSR